MAFEKICVVRTEPPAKIILFSRAIQDNFLTELSLFLFRVACSGHKEAKKIVGIKMTENRVALVIAKFTI